jgi:hypothetical protein
MATKKVNIYPQGRPITALRQMIRNNIFGADLTLEQIKSILVQNGRVDEILKDGSTVTLTLENYDDMDLYKAIREKEEQEEAARKQAAIERKKLDAKIKEADRARQAAVNNINNIKVANIEADAAKKAAEAKRKEEEAKKAAEAKKLEESKKDAAKHASAKIEANSKK